MNISNKVKSITESLKLNADIMGLDFNTSNLDFISLYIEKMFSLLIKIFRFMGHDIIIDFDKSGYYWRNLIISDEPFIMSYFYDGRYANSHVITLSRSDNVNEGLEMNFQFIQRLYSHEFGPQKTLRYFLDFL